MNRYSMYKLVGMSSRLENSEECRAYTNSLITDMKVDDDSCDGVAA
jgi:hypothetical protein